MERSLSPRLRAAAARAVGAAAARGLGARGLAARGLAARGLAARGLAGRGPAVTVLVVTVLAAAGCSGSSGGSSAGAASGNLSWHPCPSAAGGASTAGRLEGASLQVPLNYSNPGGRKITPALSEGPATAPAGQLQRRPRVNPG